MEFGSSGREAPAGAQFHLPLGTSAPTISSTSGTSAGGSTIPQDAPFRSPRSHVAYSDRYIPSRALSSRLDVSVLERESAALTPARRPADKDEGSGAYSMMLRTELLGCPMGPPSPEKAATNGFQSSPLRSPRKMFRYVTNAEDTAGLPTQSPYSRGLITGDDDGLSSSAFASPGRLPRKIARSPFKVLDAPSLADDFYLNLVDWSSQNVLAVGLGSCVYLWSACTSKVTRLVDYGDTGAVCSVAWSGRGSYLSIGTDRGDVQIWDAAQCKRVRSMAGHKQRVGCMSWNHHVLASGSRDRSILLRDLRAPEPWNSKLSAHRSEVCGLKWSPEDRELASGGNDNQLLIWNPTGGASAAAVPVQRFTEHQAAVKAIAWSPHQHGLVASGGGTADRCIRFWNTSTGQPLHSVDTGSQVCNLSWSKNVNELVSTHGYSQNQIVVWKYPGMQKLATLTGHTMRVLYLAVSPDGQTIVTGAGDETLRFWNVFPGPKAQAGGDIGVGSMMRTLIR